MSKPTQIRDGAIAKIPTQEGDVSTIPDNSVSTQKLQDLSVEESKLSLDVADKINTATHKNYIVNGDMRIAQRGTSFAAIANGAYSLDRFAYAKVGSAVHTLSQGTDVPTFAQSGYLFQNSLVATLTTPDDTISSSDIVRIIQRIEGYNFTNLAQKPFTLSFWVKATLAGTYCVAFLNSTGDRIYVAEYVINSSNTWEKKVINVDASPASGTWNYANGIGMTVNWTLAAGTDFQQTAGSWQTQASGKFATSNQVNGVATGSTSFLITGVMLNEGTQAQPFRTFADNFQGELAACQRYTWVPGYDTSVDSTTQMPFASGHCTGTTTALIILRLPIKMRVRPTLTVNAASNFAVRDNDGDVTALTSISVNRDGTETLELAATVAAGLATGNATELIRNNTTAGIMTISAEL